MKIKIKKINEDAKMPRYAHEGDAGMDIYSSENTEIKKGEVKLVGTGLTMEIPQGYEAQVRPKSGLAAKHGITLLNTPGTIDSGYRGELKVIMVNHSQKPYVVEKGSKIAQIVFAAVEKANVEEVKELNESVRGEGGFGSTGLK